MPLQTLYEIRSLQVLAKKYHSFFVVSLIASPVAPSFILKFSENSLWVLLIGFFFITTSFFALAMRSKILKKLTDKFESLEVGFILEKKPTTTQPRQFIIINKCPQHFSLRCIQTGQNILVSKNRIGDDFDIAN